MALAAVTVHCEWSDPWGSISIETQESPDAFPDPTRFPFPRPDRDVELRLLEQIRAAARASDRPFEDDWELRVTRKEQRMTAPGDDPVVHVFCRVGGADRPHTG